ncbi:hypothetical protein CSQ89_08340 [Chitinimonas sp. BJB300]|nr:hypothetical protein CSQ89_08340 [Chitinimonas sp. BJB300]
MTVGFSRLCKAFHKAEDRTFRNDRLDFRFRYATGHQHTKEAHWEPSCDLRTYNHELMYFLCFSTKNGWLTVTRKTSVYLVTVEMPNSGMKSARKLIEKIYVMLPDRIYLFLHWNTVAD